MELVSVLAGERWTDAPRCTHPLLARLARLVNDAVDDGARQALAQHAPTLVGLRSDDPVERRRWDAELALLAATTALPVAAPWHQRPLAAALLTCDEQLTGAPRQATRAALDAAPDAARWAAGYTAGLHRRPHVDASAVVEFAVIAVAQSDAPDADARLVALLADAVDTVRRLAHAQPVPAHPVSAQLSAAGGPRSSAGARAAAPAPRR